MNGALNIDGLLAETSRFINTMYVVRESFSLLPDKEHIATCIDYADLLEMREDFVQELLDTVCAFIYSKQDQEKIIQRFLMEGNSISGAWSKLLRRCKQKFRPSSVQGQFSELLLCNLLQHYFKAIPVVRKMSITTNVAMERNGADAIHIANHNGKYVIYIGEAKTYDQGNGSLGSAIKDAVKDVISKHYQNHRNELDLYLLEDFIPEDIENIVRSYRSGDLKDVEVHLVCIVTYNVEFIIGNNKAEKLECIIKGVKEATKNIKNSKTFKSIPAELLPRLNYIIFPVHEMEKLIQSFASALGL